jgi:anti-anti-sigma factor
VLVEWQPASAHHFSDADPLSMAQYIIRAPRLLVKQNRRRFAAHADRVMDDGQLAIIVDFYRTEYVDSFALGMLVSLQKRLNRRGGTLEISRLSRDISTLFELTKLDTLFVIRDVEPEGQIDTWIAPEPDEIPAEAVELDEWGTPLDLDQDTGAPLRVVRSIDAQGYPSLALVLYGRAIPEEDVTVWSFRGGGEEAGTTERGGREPLEMWLGHPENVPELLAFPVSEVLPRAVILLEIPQEPIWAVESAIGVTASVQRVAGRGPAFSLSLRFRAVHWKRLWSISEYVDALRSTGITWGGEQLDIVWEAEDNSELVLRLAPADPAMPLRELLARSADLIAKAHEDAEASLASGIRPDSMVAHFRVPPAIRSACEQYLVHFVQFLRELGVEADAEVQHQGSDILFAVTPTSRPEALDKIRRALEVYLQLTSLGDAELASASAADHGVQPLVAQLYHLRGQLAYQGAVIEQKDATIALQKTHIELLSRGASPSDSEALGEFMAVQSVTKAGVTLQLPVVVRRLRQWFATDEPLAPNDWF